MEVDALAEACQGHGPQRKGLDPRGTHVQQHSLRCWGRLQAPERPGMGMGMNSPQHRLREGVPTMSLPASSALLTRCVPARGPRPNPRRSGAQK